MMHRYGSYAFAAFIVLLTGCTGGSVKVVLPTGHPANPSANEALFVPPPDPFSAVVIPSPREETPGHRHEHRPALHDDDMRMDDMRMDDDQQGHMEHGGHQGATDKKEGK